MRKPIFSDHGMEIALLGIIASGVIWLCWSAISKDAAAEASAWTAVLMAIIGAIKDRWNIRSVDQMGQRLASSAPTPDGPQPVQVVNDKTDPVPVKGE